MKITFILLMLVLPLIVKCQNDSIDKKREKLMNGVITPVSFCELAKHPEKYSENTIELTADYIPDDKGAYLTSKSCESRPNERIGFGYYFAENGKVVHADDRQVEKILS